MITPKIAVVTGGNKGIGFEIVKGLAQQLDGHVYLTARDPKLGLDAVEELEKQGLKAKFHQLDIDKIESINLFAKYIQETYGGLDILVNNAAVLFRENDSKSEEVEKTIKTNFTGTLNVCQALFPLLRPHARVVNVSSRMGLLKAIKDEKIRNMLTSSNATVEDIQKIMNDYVELSKIGKHEEICSSSYGMSKAGLNALTAVHQRIFDSSKVEDIIVSAVTPGYVATDMTQYKGHLTPQQGAETPLFACFLPPNEKRGVFWADKKFLDWTDLTL